MRKLQDICINIINIICIVSYLFVFYAVMFTKFDSLQTIYGGLWNGNYTASDMIANGIIVIITIFLCLVGSFIYVKTGKREKMNYKKWLFIATIVLLFVQLFVAYQIYHYGWADVQLIREAAYCFANGEKQEWFYSWYLPQCPNQIYLYFIYIVAFRIANCVGIGNGYLYLILLNIVMANLACYFSAKVVYKLTNKSALAKVVYVMAALLIGLSPWIVFPYTDMLSVLVPILAYYIYLEIREREMPTIVKWLMIGCLPIMLYPLKATNIILLIAIIITEVFVFKHINMKSMLWAVVGLGCVFSLSTVMGSYIERYVGYEPNEDLERDIKWYALLGSNYEIIGNWNFEDADLYDYALDTKEKKDRVVPEIIKYRYKNMWGGQSLIQHWIDKCHMFYDDGTFCWGYNGMIESFREMDSPEATFFRNLMWPDGKYGMTQSMEGNVYYGEQYRYFVVYQQILWMSIFAMMGVGIIFGDKNSKQVMILKLVWTGIFLFSMLFETNARLLINYLPIFCVMAGLGNENLINMIGKKYERRKNKFNER